MRSIILLSGGVDSSVALALKVAQYGAEHVAALSVNYGQRHHRELNAAQEVARFYGVQWHQLDVIALSALLDSTLTTTRKVDPELSLFGRPTVVPGRNAILLSAAAGWAQSLSAEEVCIACHAGDRYIYPDCRPEFLETLSRATEAAYGVRVHGLFLSYAKEEIVALGKRLEVPFGLTWSCYAGGEEPCGKCGACQERAKAFGLEMLPRPD